MQLDFIGNIYNNSFIQGDLFDAPVARKPFTKDVEEFFHSVSSNEIEEHQNYWSKLIPDEPEQKFQRYLFAFLSVHTSWENNVKAYIRIKDFWNWMGNEEELRSRLIECGVGLHNNRVRDTHLFQLYKLNQSKHGRQYKNIEDHWLTWSKMFNIPSYIARSIFWNRKQKQNNCHYWAYCL